MYRRIVIIRNLTPLTSEINIAYNKNFEKNVICRKYKKLKIIEIKDDKWASCQLNIKF